MVLGSSSTFYTGDSARIVAAIDLAVIALTAEGGVIVKWSLPLLHVALVEQLIRLIDCGPWMTSILYSALRASRLRSSSWATLRKPCGLASGSETTTPSYGWSLHCPAYSYVTGDDDPSSFATCLSSEPYLVCLYYYVVWQCVSVYFLTVCLYVCLCAMLNASGQL